MEFALALILVHLLGSDAPPDFAGRDLYAVLPADGMGYLRCDVAALRGLAREELGEALAQLAPVDPENDLLPLSAGTGIPAPILQQLLARTAVLHLALPSLTERTPRWLLGLEGPIDDLAREAIAALREGPSAEQFRFENLAFGPDIEVMVVSQAQRGGRGVAIGIRPGLVLLAPEVGALRDALRGVAAVEAGELPPDSIRAAAQRAGLEPPAPGAEMPPFSGSINPRGLLQIAHYEEFRGRMIDDSTGFDLLFDLGALGPGLLAWGEDGVVIDSAIDPRSDLRAALRPSSAGLGVAALGSDQLFFAAAALENPGAAIPAYVERLRSVLRIAGEDDLDEFETEMRQVLGHDLSGIGAQLRELAVLVLPGPLAGLEHERALLQRSALVASWADGEALAAAIASILGRFEADGRAVSQREVDGVVVVDLGPRAPALASRGTLLVIAADGETSRTVLAQAEAALTEDASGEDAALARVSIDRQRILSELLPGATIEAEALGLVLQPTDAGLRLVCGLSPREVMRSVRPLVPAIQARLAEVERARLRTAAMQHLRLAAHVLRRYQRHNGAWPQQLQVVIDAGQLNQERVTCPLTGERYTYLLPVAGAGEDRMLLHGPPLEDGQRLVALADGSTRSVDAQAFAELQAEAQRQPVEAGAEDF